MGEDLIVEAEAARILSVTLNTLRDRRKCGNVPLYQKCNCGHSYLYRRSDIARLERGKRYQPEPAS